MNEPKKGNKAALLVRCCLKNTCLINIPLFVCVHVSYQVKEEDSERLSAFFNRNSYLAGRYTDGESFTQLQCHLDSLAPGIAANRLFYLALPPTVYNDVTKNIRQHCMSDESVPTYSTTLL